jgi:hypothetical protein
VTLLDRVRAALDGYRYVSETSAQGGVVFEWGAGVTGDVAEWIERSSEVVIAECVVRRHGELRAGGINAAQAMLGLVHHEPDREQLQRILLGHTRHPELRRLAVTCLGHVGRLDGEVLPQAVSDSRLLDVSSDRSAT